MEKYDSFDIFENIIFSNSGDGDLTCLTF